ncbi:MAG: CinA family protein [Thermomicrobiales bacterium]
MTGSLNELAARLQKLAIARGVTVATAESCTGGGIAREITRISGSSGYFLGSVVAYANDVKHRVLGVPNDVLENRGAVSEACARAMIVGVRSLMGADYAVSTTGIAGPLGGTARKPVGLVYIGVGSAGGAVAEEHVFPGDRAAVIEAATARALELLIAAVTGESG